MGSAGADALTTWNQDDEEQQSANWPISALSANGHLDAPTGSYDAGQHCVVLQPRDELRGVSLWGRPDAHDIDLVIGALASGAARNDPTCVSLLIDIRRLESVDLRVFEEFFHQLRSFWERFERFGKRQAVLHRGGLLAGIAVMVCSASHCPLSAKPFAEPSEAIAWLGANNCDLVADLDRVYREVSSNGSLLLAVRGHLRTKPATDLGGLAAACGVSPRTLQRRLCELGTTFQQETSNARLRTAKTLMTKTDYPLKHIALDCGFASLQHFSAFFREQVGTPPSRWRALHVCHIPSRRRLIEGGAPP